MSADDIEQRVAKAVRRFWDTRKQQGERQGSKSGRKDAGSRSHVTGGKHIDGFVDLMSEILVESGLPDHRVFRKKSRSDTVLPGWFRPSKEWDLVAIVDGTIVATMEFKSQVGSFGNNFNNRTEEAIGNALDIRTAYREGAFGGSPKPWLGYFMLLEDAPGSNTPVRMERPHFGVFPEFENASYAKRYCILCQKLVREQLYDAACFIMSNKQTGPQGEYREPLEEIGCRAFVTSLMGRAIAFAKMREKK